MKYNLITKKINSRFLEVFLSNEKIGNIKHSGGFLKGKMIFGEEIINIVHGLRIDFFYRVIPALARYNFLKTPKDKFKTKILITRSGGGQSGYGTKVLNSEYTWEFYPYINKIESKLIHKDDSNKNIIVTNNKNDYILETNYDLNMFQKEDRDYILMMIVLLSRIRTNLLYGIDGKIFLILIIISLLAFFIK